MGKLVVLIVVLFCAAISFAQEALRPTVAESQAESVKVRTTSTRDDFKKLFNFKGPNLFQNGPRSLFLRATRFDKSAELFIQLYFRDQYDGEWRFYDSAYDIEGNKLDFVSIDRKVDTCAKYGCSHFEDVGITLTRDYLDSRRETGTRLKVSGRAGEAIVVLPPGYIQGFLQALDSASEIQRLTPPSNLPSELTKSDPVAAASAYMSIAPNSGVLRDGISWAWPTSGRIVSGFDPQAAMKGIDIAVNPFAAVSAAASGKVVYIGKEPRGSGSMVVVNHVGGAVSVYFHVDVVVVQSGQQVSLGQKIGELNGDADRKIHFEIRRNGRPLDPLTLIQ